MTLKELRAKIDALIDGFGEDMFIKVALEELIDPEELEPGSVLDFSGKHMYVGGILTLEVFDEEG